MTTSEARTLEKLPEVLTAKDISLYMRVSITRVYEQMRINPSAGGIPHIKMGKQMRVRKDDFIAWMDAQRKLAR